MSGTGLADFKERQFIAVIGDEASFTPAHPVHLPRRNRPNTSQDSVTGLLLAGIGVRSALPDPGPPRRPTR